MDSLSGQAVHAQAVEEGLHEIPQSPRPLPCRTPRTRGQRLHIMDIPMLGGGQDALLLEGFEDKPEKAIGGGAFQGRPSRGVSGDHRGRQLAKSLGVPIGLTVMPGNTYVGKHMLTTFG